MDVSKYVQRKFIWCWFSRCHHQLEFKKICARIPLLSILLRKMIIVEERERKRERKREREKERDTLKKKHGQR